MTDLKAVDAAVNRSVVLNDAEDRAAYIRETVLTDLADVRTVVREIEAGTYPMIPAEVAAKIRRLETTVCLTTFYDKPDAPAPYTEPREGDEVEVTVRGRVTRTADGDDWALQYADMCVDMYGRMRQQVFAKALADGRVRLVKAAAPTWEPGTLYRSPSADGQYVYAPVSFTLSDDHPMEWYRLHPHPGWLTSATMPSDLVPCDVVPREAT